MGSTGNAAHREPWNKGKIVGQKGPFKLKDIWALRVRLQREGCTRELQDVLIEPRKLWPSGGPRKGCQRSA
jgi:hypothetical protein